MLSRESSASKRYGHREDCTLLFDKHPLFVVEQQHVTGLRIYLVGDREGLFTLDESPLLREDVITDLLKELRAEKLQKIEADCQQVPFNTGLEWL